MAEHSQGSKPACLYQWPSPFSEKLQIWFLTIGVINERMGEASRDGSLKRFFWQMRQVRLKRRSGACVAKVRHQVSDRLGVRTQHSLSTVCSLCSKTLLPQSLSCRPAALLRRPTESYTFLLCPSLFLLGLFPLSLSLTHVSRRGHTGITLTLLLSGRKAQQVSRGNSLINLCYTDPLFANWSGSVYSKW